jgi:hypothetical protein
MVATFGSRLATTVAQPTFQAIAAGVLAGAITGGALIVAGIVPPAGPPRTALLACPGSGAVVANVPAGQSLLATARSEDGAWLEVYIGQPGIDGAWAPAAAVHLQGSIDGLPVADCAPPSSIEPTPQPLPSPVPSVAGTLVPDVEPTGEPSPSFSPGPSLPPSATPSPTPKPTASPKATVKPTPTMTFVPPPTDSPPPPTDSPPPPPDTTAPSITNVSINGAYTSGDGNYYIYPPAATGCPYHSATISATVADTGGSGLAGYTVTLHWKDPFGSQYNQQMSFNLVSHLYNKTITAVNGWPENAYLEYWITASDNAGNPATTSHPPDNSHWLFTGQCLL